MDVRNLVSIITILLMDVGPCLLQINQTTPTITESTKDDDSSRRDCSCSPTGPSFTAKSSVSSLSFITVSWTGQCEGDIHQLHHSSNTVVPVCHSNKTIVQSLLSSVCEGKKGCKGTPNWKEGSKTLDDTSSCKRLRLHCADDVVVNIEGQLQLYKVMTALLSFVLAMVLAIRFYTPTVKALQKRLSDRRQNRWIGPTQSHSVSYHRGKGALKNTEGEKRLSYPALERGALYESREPSSNRTSEYNF